MKQQAVHEAERMRSVHDARYTGPERRKGSNIDYRGVERRAAT
jgi:hypothetical protein